MVLNNVNNLSKPSKNFKYFDDLINSGLKEIVLDSNIILDDDEISQYSQGIKVYADNLVIDGNGYTIDANDRTRIFKCSGKNITIKNLKFKNGVAEMGGGIYNDGELTIASSIFNQNIAEMGGGIYNDGELTIASSIFNQNMAEIGGSIDNNGKFIIFESTFNENSSEDGGAIYNSGEMTITDSTLNENISKDGGAIYNSGEMTITDSTLNENSSEDGGAIYNGVLFNGRGRITITKSIFNKNVARRRGIILNWGELSISESSLNNNITRGKSINSMGEFCKLTMKNCNIKKNVTSRIKSFIKFRNKVVYVCLLLVINAVVMLVILLC